jgi:hypothetical protein
MTYLKLGFYLVRGLAFNGNTEQAVDYGKAKRKIKGMGDEIIRITVKNTEQVSDRSASCEDEDRDNPVIFVGFDMATDLKSLFVKSRGITDKKIRFSFAECIKEISPVGKEGNPVSLFLKVLSKQRGHCFTYA